MSTSRMRFHSGLQMGLLLLPTTLGFVSTNQASTGPATSTFLNIKPPVTASSTSLSLMFDGFEDRDPYDRKSWYHEGNSNYQPPQSFSEQRQRQQQQQNGYQQQYQPQQYQQQYQPQQQYQYAEPQYAQQYAEPQRQQFNTYAERGGLRNGAATMQQYNNQQQQQQQQGLNTVNNGAQPMQQYSAGPLQHVPQRQEQQQYDQAAAAAQYEKKELPFYKQNPTNTLFTGSTTSSTVQGDTRRTFTPNTPYTTNNSPTVVSMATNGRPMNSQVDIWDGPDNTVGRFNVQAMDGQRNQFHALVDNGNNASPYSNFADLQQQKLHKSPNYGGTTAGPNYRDTGLPPVPQKNPNYGGTTKSPKYETGRGKMSFSDYYDDGRGYQREETYRSPTVSVRNEGPVEFPVQAQVANGGMMSPNGQTTFTPARPLNHDYANDIESVVDGGSMKTFHVEPHVQRVLVQVSSQGLPIQAVVELWEGPGQARQVAEVYVQDGLRRPMSAVIDTPGEASATIAVYNQGPTEFPISASVEPY